MEKNDASRPVYSDVVLIPTDFSEVCDNAIHHGMELARYLGFSAYILHVINKESRSSFEPEEITEKLEKYKERYTKEYGLKVETITREGSIFEVINNVASEIQANIMVMGTHGKKGLQYLFGSYALKVVLDSPCPVVVVQKRSFGKGYHKIVFPVTNDLEVRQKVAWAVMISQLFQSRIYLYLANEKDPHLANRLNFITAQIAKVFDQKKVEYEVVKAARKSDYAGQVIDFATANACDMIMVMTVPQIDIPGFSVASWDESMMFNETEIPVMCVNPTKLSNYYYEWVTLY
jgi:nucleotide-binding universal stress UspA family protein